MKSERRRKLYKWLDGFAPYYEALAEFMHRRPVFVLAVLVSSIIVAIAAVTFATTAKEVSSVSNAFCNGQKEQFDEMQRRNCRSLLDQLLKDPSPQQKERIKEIAREK